MMKWPGPIQAYDGVILQVRKRGRQQVLTVFTKQKGIMTVFAQRRSKMRQGFGAFLPFSDITFDAVLQTEVLALREYACRSNGAMAHLTWECYVYSQIFIDMILCFMPQGQADQPVYELLRRYSRFLTKKDPRVVTIIAGWQLAALAGFYPDAERMRIFIGMDEAKQRRYYFGDDPPAFFSGWPVPEGIRQLWQTMLHYEWGQESVLKLNAKYVSVLEQMLYSYVEQCSEKALKSISLLHI